jgi:hypothetical protein
MYKKIVELPISYYSEKKGDIMARMLGDKWSSKLFFFHLELVVKDLTIIFLSNHVYYKHKAYLICFDFMPISGWIISKVAKIWEHNHYRRKEKVVSDFYCRWNFRWTEKIKVIMLKLLSKEIQRFSNPIIEFNKQYRK